MLNLGKGLGDVSGDLLAIAVLTVLAYAAGTWLFARRHLRAR